MRFWDFPCEIVSFISHWWLKFTYLIEGDKDFYFISLPISLRAFLPSLRVLFTNQEKKEKINMTNITSEIEVLSKYFFKD